MENWKRINHETYNDWEISSEGRVRKGEKILKTNFNKYGYERVTLTKNKKRKEFTIHRLVALTFIPNPKKLATVNHKDLDKKNNNLENLEWMTNLENIKHARENDAFKDAWRPCHVEKECGEYVGHFKSIRELCLSLKLVNRTEVVMAINGGFCYRGYRFIE